MDPTSPSEANVRPVPRLRVEWRNHVTYIAFAVLFLFFAVTLQSRGFLEISNLLNVIRQTAMISIMAVAMTFVLASGEIDLSIGAVAGLVSVVAATVLESYGLAAGILAGLAAGLLVGGTNGFLVTTMKLPSFLATLAMMGIARGAAMWISSTGSVPILNPTFNFMFGSGSIAGIPVLALWVVLALIVGHVALKHTGFGRKVLATGGNRIAARYSGVPVNAIRFRVMMIAASSAALAGLLYAGRLHSGRYQLGEGDELSVIAAAVLGGTGLFGGSGTVIGSIAGSLMIGLINNGLLLFGLDFSQQLIARGLIIIVAIILSRRE